jgi:hypothetical protein
MVDHNPLAVVLPAYNAAEKLEITCELNRPFAPLVFGDRG